LIWIAYPNVVYEIFFDGAMVTFNQFKTPPAFPIIGGIISTVATGTYLTAYQVSLFLRYDIIVRGSRWREPLRILVGLAIFFSYLDGIFNVLVHASINGHWDSQLLIARICVAGVALEAAITLGIDFIYLGFFFNFLMTERRTLKNANPTFAILAKYGIGSVVIATGSGTGILIEYILDSLDYDRYIHYICVLEAVYYFGVVHIIFSLMVMKRKLQEQDAKSWQPTMHSHITFESDKEYSNVSAK
jgi:hypothetical protein